MDLTKLESKDPKVKFGFGKKLLQLAAEKPEMLYDDFDYWVNLLGSENQILKWTAMDIIGHLSEVDRDNKVDKQIGKLFKILHGGKLISSGHAIFALTLIAENKPKYKKEIISEMLGVSKDKFETTECKQIIAGKVVLALENFIEEVKSDKAALNFIKKTTSSTRNATKKKAEALLKKLAKVPAGVQA